MSSTELNYFEGTAGSASKATSCPRETKH